MALPLITLTTDFGEGSLYVAEMKGAIFSILPDARIVDLTHGISPQNIRLGALALEQVTPRFPPGSIHVAVVDPGVGTKRKIVYACLDGRHYIAPDNGLLGLLAGRHAPSAVFALTNYSYWSTTVSKTFHGRDIMAPVAAHLCCGTPPEALGEPLADLAPLDWPPVRLTDNGCLGEVIAVDSFGNLITNIERELLEGADASHVRIECAGRMIEGLTHTYGEVAPGNLLALIGSNERLEIAVANGNAQATLSARLAAPVAVSGIHIVRTRST